MSLSPTGRAPVRTTRDPRGELPSRSDLETGVDAFAELRVLDFGDAPVVPADPARSHVAIEETVGQVLAAGALPMVLGGDHSITEANARACAAVHGPLGLVHFDTHADTGGQVFGVEYSHETIMRRLVEDGHVTPNRYAQVGLRGYWPGEKEFSWQAEHGITSLFMHDVRDLGIGVVVRRAVEAVGPGPIFLTVDIDVLNPAFAPGTGTPEIGGYTSRELLTLLRAFPANQLVGADVVEVSPPYDHAEVTSLAAATVLYEIMGLLARTR